PDPSFFFGSRQHRKAMAYLEYGLHQSEGFIVVTGDVGAGKTTLVRNLLDKLDPSEVLAVNLVSTQLDAEDMLRMVAAAFGLRTKDLQKADLLLALEAFLLSITEQGKRALIIVDEAQNLAPGAVEELRMLSNFQIEDHALLQSFLVGQPEFRNILQSPRMQQLRQRVIASCHVGPMDAEDTRSYIEHRLRFVGWQDKPQFEPQVFDIVYQFSEGIPRRINALCDRLLMSGFLSNKHGFTAEDAREMATEIRHETHGASGPSSPESGASQPTSVGETRQDLRSVDLSKFELSPELGAQAARVIAGVTASQFDERLMRLERSSNAILGLLEQFVASVTRRDDN
ncbi:MAG: XrtA/PEP-CTERM system-associated ATPase, partial [Rhodocyclaceae bacterium]